MPSQKEVIETAARLRQARAATGLNQTQFAKKIGITAHRYNQYESEKRPLTIDVANRICDEFGFTLDWLYRGHTTLLPSGLLDLIRNQRASSPIPPEN
jgi:transcriptional regulator with XRE-family HTH domain